MMQNLYTISAENELQHVAQDLLREYSSGTIIALQGPLGAGKTTLTQYIAKELGIIDPITSPTFTYANEYVLPNVSNGIAKLIHIDMYRLTPHQAEAKGVLDMISEPGAITVVEWAEKLKGWLPEKTVWIEIQPQQQSRILKVSI